MTRSSLGSALVTGASSGIGAVYADRLAKRGYDLILVARNGEKLKSLAARLTAETHRSVKVMPADLGDKVALAKIEAVLRDDPSISMLVNNAGTASIAPLLNSDVDQMEAMIALNVTALTRLTYAAAPAFVARGAGTIINIGSVVGVVPERLNGVYGATKAFVLALSQSLQHELADKGVRIQAVLPAATATDIWEKSGLHHSKLPAGTVMSTEDMVDAALTGLDQGEVVTIPPLQDGDDWTRFDAARLALAPKLTNAAPAPRYRAARASSKHRVRRNLTKHEDQAMTSRSVVIAEPVRTAIGAFGGTLKDVPAPDLGAVAIRAAVERAGLKPEEIETAAMGNVIQAGTKMNPARQAAVQAGLPVTVPALTVNRVCGSGAQAIVSAAQEILLGNANAAVAGGMESMDQAPYLVQRGRWGYRLGDGQLYDSVLRDGLNDAFSGEHSGWHTEDLVEKYQVTREAQDQWALRSQQRFARAQSAGHFKSQIAAVQVPGKKGPTPFDQDEANRPDTTIEALARLKPAFRPDGAITAGNAPGLNDAAAAMVLADEAWAEKRGLKPAARLVAYGIAAVEPGMFGLGPVPAVKQALQRAGWEIESIERAEINEAFAAIAIVVARELGFSDEIVNVEGGAVAHGHPIGATGAVLTTKLIHSMRRDGLKRGLVTLCIGGGQGIALAIETLH